MSRVYANKAPSPRENTRQERDNLSPEFLARVMDNIIKQTRMVINSGGVHLADIIFKT